MLLKPQFSQPGCSDAVRRLFRKNIISVFPAQMFEMATYASLIEFIHSKGEQWSSGILWPHRVRYAFDPFNKLFSSLDLSEFERSIGPVLPTCRQLGIPRVEGRLGQSVEGGGKRRIFAIGNYVNQRLLKPIHDWLMSVLKMIPMDGTFQQERPLDRLVGERHVFSFDLKSATDRWPLLLLFEVPFVKKLTNVCFVAGQPLGYYSSWPLFALSHHILVWHCAEQVHPGLRFDKYAVLGDDVVIADSKVSGSGL